MKLIDMRDDDSDRADDTAEGRRYPTGLRLTLDDAAIDLQLVTPTHLIASFRSRPTACRYPRRRSPQRTLRTPTDEPDGVQPGHDAGPLDAGEALGLREPEAAIAQLRREHDEAWGRYNHLRRRKAVRLALALAAARHWRPRGDGGRG